jgi:DNA-binding MarR family transcriptional regulator
MTEEAKRQKLIDGFFDMVDSLKKCRRADLSDINSDEDIIEKLYVDPLNNEFVLKTSLRPNTTILIGRKGTGKSTIIARLQHEVRKSKDKLSLYLDVKTIFDQSRTFNYNSSNFNNILEKEDLDQYFLFKSFLKLILSQIEEEVKTNTLRFFLANISNKFGPDKNTFKDKISEIFKNIDKKESEDILILKEKIVKTGDNDSNEDTNIEKFDLGIKASEKSLSGEVSMDSSTTRKTKHTANIDEAFSEIFLQYYEPHKVLLELKKLLKEIGINHVFICLDDFSEIEEEAMKVFVDTIVSPLNNWSEEFFKFKIAGYPNRIYLGDIDPQKIEQIKLDYYDLYQSGNVSNTQKEAVNNVQRLLTKRCNYFCNTKPETFFSHSEKNPIEDFYQLIFDCTSNVPRNIGWILWYAYQNSIAKGKKITLQDLSVASEKFYNDTVQVYFSKNKYMRGAFSEKLEKFHLNEVINNIIGEAKLNKTEISKSDSKIFQAEKTKPPTSHFYIDKQLENVLRTLELNYFITKYSEQKDQEGKTLMTFYSLNHGLCKTEDIHYGKGKDRKYVIQRRFNYSEIVREYIADAKQFVCNNCTNTLPYEKLEMLEMFDMLCPKCKKGNCYLKHVEVEIPEQIDISLQLPEFDIRLLNSIKINEPQYPTSLAQELDCSYQKASKRAVKLVKEGLLKTKRLSQVKGVGVRTYYFLTEKANKTYFE